MSIDRIRAKLQQAAGVAKRVVDSIEAEADAIIADEYAIRKQKDEAFAPHKALLAESRVELDAVKDALNHMSNGGPPLNPLEDVESSAPAEPVVSNSDVVAQATYPRFA